MNIKNLYKELIMEFIKNNNLSDKKAVIFFQGFPGIFYEALEETDIKRLFSYEMTNQSNYCDYSKINNNLELTSFLKSEELCWAYYEELISLNSTLNDFSVYSGELIIVKNNLFNEFFPLDIYIDENKVRRIFEEDLCIEDNILNYYSDIRMYNGKIFYSYVNKHYDVDLNKEIKVLEFFTSISTDKKIFNNTIDLNPANYEYEKYLLLNGKISNVSYSLINCNVQDIDIQLPLINAFGKEAKVSFNLNKNKIKTETESPDKYLPLLKKYWGEEAEFRNMSIYKDPAISNELIELSQGFLINNVIDQIKKAKSDSNYSDIIITAPTGSGKSIFFQLPSIYMHNECKLITIVITPLIALMNDQVKEITEQHGVDFATYINSDITFEERQRRIEGIKNGEYSMVYLSPELLLANDIRSIVGDREIGLFVVDEAHLVTSWGRDFRVDYWFLGDYIEKIRRGSYYAKEKSMQFPVLCLTATAVFGGTDDVIEELQKSLNLSCSSENVFFGSVRRDNPIHSIEFKINVVGEKKSNTNKEEKINLTCNKIIKFIESEKKAIIYFPYVSQIEDVYKKIIELRPEYSNKIERYSGSGMDKFEKNESYERFRASKVSIMLATKAFGMGINIPDVDIVYHFAPTGTLADYVQEIGRAARQVDKGYAVADYLKNDMNYAKVLWGLSGLRHYQIKAIMKKLYNLYAQCNKRNILVSPEEFGFIFDNRNIDNKVKSGLMLLSADLLEKYHFSVINVRSKNIFSVNYICIPNEIEQNFLHTYGDYCKLMSDDKPKVLAAFGKSSEVIVKNIGNVYEIDLSKVWEEEFQNITFASFKYKFFNGDLFETPGTKISPRTRLVIHYKDYEKAGNVLFEIASSLQYAFNSIHKKYGGKEFNFEDFNKCFQEKYESKLKREYMTLLLDLFCYEGVAYGDIPAEQWKFIEKRKSSNGAFVDLTYCIRTRKFKFIEQNIKRYFKNSEPNTESGSFVAYLPIPRQGQKYSEFQLVASILEMFNLATYELTGGKNPQIFVRINDPLKLKRLSDSPTYRNSLLSDIENRHKRAVKIVNSFMTHDKTDKERWDIIENYFLGNDELVNYELKLDDSSSVLAL